MHKKILVFFSPSLVKSAYLLPLNLSVISCDGFLTSAGALVPSEEDAVLAVDRE